MAKVKVGRAARRHITQLERYVVTLRYGPVHGWTVGVRHGLRRKTGRVLKIGPLARARLLVLKHKMVNVHYSEPTGFWVKIGAAPPSPRQTAVNYCLQALQYAGRMVYDEGPLRSELFNRKPGDFLGAHADCSQFVSSIMHWSGVENVNEWDDTGTLLEKGRTEKTPAIGRLIIAGAGTGVHVGMFTGKIDDEWMIAEDGDQAAPDHISQSAFMAYFRNRGVSEFRYRDFF